MGYSVSLSEIPDNLDNLLLVKDLMEWANSNKAPVLSLDFPSGISALDGTYE